MFIYKITNRINGKVYIGQTVQQNPKRRWYEHRAAAKGDGQQHLYQSMRKHGINSFDWEVIDQADSLEKLNQLETKWIEHFRMLVECYNHRDGGDNSLHSDISKQRMSEAQKAAHARRRTEGRDTWTRSDGGAMLGKKHPRKGTSGLWHYTEEQKEKQSILMNQINGTRGKTWKTIDGKRVYMEKNQ
jgi:group I intron endonuclease